MFKSQFRPTRLLYHMSQGLTSRIFWSNAVSTTLRKLAETDGEAETVMEALKQYQMVFWTEFLSVTCTS